jgi:hypothetical protein
LLYALSMTRFRREPILLSLALLLGACFSEPGVERGRSFIATVPAADDAQSDVAQWDLYEEPAAIEAIGNDAQGLEDASVQVIAEQEDTVVVVVETASDTAWVRFDSTGAVVDLQAPADPATQEAVEDASAALDVDECPECAGAWGKGTAIGIAGTCALALGTAIAAVWELGVNVPVNLVAEGSGVACFGGAAAYLGQRWGRIEGHIDGSRNAGFDAMPAGQWVFMERRYSTPHPYALSTRFEQTFDCPEGAIYVRPRFAWVELDRFSGVRVDRLDAGAWSLAAFLQSKGRQSTYPLRGRSLRVSLDARAERRGGNPYGFDVEGIECFFPEGTMW